MAEELDDSLLEVGVEEDPELEAIKARVREMEEEAEKLKTMQQEVEDEMSGGLNTSGSSLKFPSQEEKLEADARSVYIGNVDYGATADELEKHFSECGVVNRVTILCDRYSGHPKGFAYIEFADKSSIDAACELSDSLFRGRQIRVVAKRYNVPGISSTNRGRSRGRGRSRPSYGSFYSPYGYRPAFRGRAMYRSRRSFYSPY